MTTQKPKNAAKTKTVKPAAQPKQTKKPAKAQAKTVAKAKAKSALKVVANAKAKVQKTVKTAAPSVVQNMKPTCSCNCIWNHYVNCFKNYFGFKGRATRCEFWSFVLVNVLVSLALGVVDKILSTSGLFSSLYSLVVMVPGMAVQFRRLHDINRPGWWIFAPTAIIIVTVILVRLFMSMPTFANVLLNVGVLATIVMTFVLIYWFCKKSDAKANKYGHPAA